jgi:hypothetical protein
VSAYNERYNTEFVSFMSNFYDAAYLIAIAAEKAAANGADINSIADFRVQLNNEIRKISNLPGITIGPQDSWTYILGKVKSGDIDYSGASGDCDIDKYGDVVTNYNLSTIIKNNDGSFSYKILENVSLNK